MRLRWLTKAQRDLAQELERLAEEDRQAAARVARLLRERTELLMRFPEAGRPGRISGTRELLFPELPYILPYRVRNDAVEILRFFHTRQKPPQRW